MKTPNTRLRMIALAFSALALLSLSATLGLAPSAWAAPYGRGLRQTVPTRTPTSPPPTETPAPQTPTPEPPTSVPTEAPTEEPEPTATAVPPTPEPTKKKNKPNPPAQPPTETPVPAPTETGVALRAASATAEAVYSAGYSESGGDFGPLILLGGGLALVALCAGFVLQRVKEEGSA